MGLKRSILIGLDAADPVQVKRLMKEGKMPNLKKLLENGAANESLSMLGCLPSVTPPNWCSIATGAWPKTHGITCYTNQTLGLALELEEANWSTSNVTADYIWESFAREGKRSIVLSYCGAWPPRVTDNDKAVIIDGGGVTPLLKVTVDYQKVINLEDGEFPMEFYPHAIKNDNKDCIVMGDQYEEMEKQSVDVAANKPQWAHSAPAGLAYPCMVEDLDDTSMNDFHEECYRPSKADKIRSALKNPVNWSFELPESAKEATVVLASGTARRFMVISASDGIHYDTVSIYRNKKTEKPLATVTGIGNWSDFVIDYYMVNDEEHKISYKMRLCDIAEDGSSAIIFTSHASDMSNLNYFYPQEMGQKLYDEVGPLLQFGSVDIRGDHKENDRIVFESYAKAGCEWFADATHWLFKEYPDWQLFYTHIHSIDNFQHWFIQDTVPGRNPDYQYYRDLLDDVYTENDKFIGEMMKYLDEDTSIFVVSDHGVMPHSAGDEYAGIGTIGGFTTKVMSELGYTVTYRDENGVLQVDWTKTKAVARRSSYVYVNLKGRDPKGIVEPEDYDQLVMDIISDLYNYRNENGKRVIAHCFTRDEMAFLGMGGVHCGDILFQTVPTFNNDHANVMSTVHHEGWSMQNLCIMGGGGIKKGVFIDRVIRLTDIVPTICALTDSAIPGNVEGGIIYQALEGFEERKFERGDEWAPHGRLIGRDSAK